MTSAIAPDWTGLDLRLLRVARRISVTELAAAAERSRQAISAIEGQARPTPRAVRLYLDGLARAEGARRMRVAAAAAGEPG
jgi:hypothetical protein